MIFKFFLKNILNKHLFKKEIRIGWVINGDYSVASSRLLGYNIHEFFTSNNFFSKILYKPPIRSTENANLSKTKINEILNNNINVLILLKIHPGENIDYLLMQCKQKNILVLYIFCDKVNMELVKKTDATLVISNYYYKIIPAGYHSKVFLFFDGFEQSKDLQKFHTDKKEIKLCFVSNNVFDQLPCIKKLPSGVSLKIIGPNQKILNNSFKDSQVFKKSNFDFEYVEWDLKTVYDHILECDVGIIPWDESAIPPHEKNSDFQNTKSINRLVLFMSMGMPAIVSPIPSYLEVVQHQDNSFIAYKDSEWIKYIEFLRDNPEERKNIGKKARADVINKYSIEAKSKLLLNIISDLKNEKY